MYKKTHLLQLIPLLVVIGVMVGVVKYFGKTDGIWKTVTLEVTEKNWQESGQTYPEFVAPSWVVASLHKGDTVLNQAGVKQAEIINLQAYQQLRNYYSLFATIRLKGYIDPNTQVFTYQASPIKVGEDLHISFPNINLGGHIIQISDEVPQPKMIRLVLKIKNLSKVVADQLTPKMSVVETYTNQPILTIDSVVSKTKTSNYPIHYDSYSTATSVDLAQESFDLVLDTSAKVTEQNKTLWFAQNQSVRIGSSITISFPNAGPFDAEIQNIVLE